MNPYDRRERLSPLPQFLDTNQVEVPGRGKRIWPALPPARTIPIMLHRSRLHLSLPPDLPDHDHEPERVTFDVPPRAAPDRVDRMLAMVQQVCVAVVVSVLVVAAAGLLAGCASAPASEAAAPAGQPPAYADTEYAGLRSLGRNLSPPSLGAASFEDFAVAAPDWRVECIEGLTPARAQFLMDWTAAAMRVETAEAIPVACATEDELDVVYRMLGAPAEQPRLAGYVALPPMALVNQARSYPDGNDHLIVHEFCHHLQWTHGTVWPMPDAERERQCEAVHTQWVEARP